MARFMARELERRDARATILSHIGDTARQPSLHSVAARVELFVLHPKGV